MSNFFKTSIIDPALNNLAAVFFWGGLLLVFCGAIFGDVIDSWTYIPEGTGNALLKSGSAILGAGVFAVIIKSFQFTQIFQSHVFDVFHNPNTIKNGLPLLKKWREFTNHILQDFLPNSNEDATKKIEKQFFNTKLEYHFQDHLCRYKISVDNEANIATVTSTTTSTLILSKNATNPILDQFVQTDGTFELKALILNGINCCDDNVYKIDAQDCTKRILSLPIKEYTTGSENTNVKMERVVEWTQDLTKDPVIKGNIIRYTKGAEIKIKCTSEHKINFERFGLGKLPEDHYTEDDGNGYQSWRLAMPENLLLPGQGYIIIIN